jgi:hypothetical protein
MFGHQDNNDNQHQGGSPLPPPEPKNDSVQDDNTRTIAPPAQDHHAQPDSLIKNVPADATLEDTKLEEHPAGEHPAVVQPPQDDELLNIKTQALGQLSPLVGHLDQTPEEKFRTTMMMIQANDNQALIKEAYETAQQITNEKAKAQALLDIVNEINYFTTGKDSSEKE